MEFKGTKGKWIVGINYNDVVLTDTGAYRPNSMQTVNSTTNELKANALLISKAPELLEMVNRMLNVYGRGYEPKDGVQDTVGSKLYKEAQQLIKEATELNHETDGN